jgi:hypothetical protein
MINLVLTKFSGPKCHTDSLTELWAIQPTGREVTDFKKPVSERIKRVPRAAENAFDGNFRWPSYHTIVGS